MLLRSALTIALILLLAGPAHAIRCSQWKRMSPEQQDAAIDRMIAGAVRSSDARRMRLKDGRVTRCLQDRSYRMAQDFDDACSDSRAPMNELQNIFRRYAWTCVG